jgi:hypothetical protein
MRGQDKSSPFIPTIVLKQLSLHSLIESTFSLNL